MNAHRGLAVLSLLLGCGGPGAPTLRAGETATLIELAALVPAGEVPAWSATCGTVTSAALFTPPGCPGPFPQTCTVKVGWSTGAATSSVTVIEGTKLVITPASVTVQVGQTVQFTASEVPYCS